MLTINSGFDVSGNVTVGGNLAVTGASTLTGTVTANSNVNVAGRSLKPPKVSLPQCPLRRQAIQI